MRSLARWLTSLFVVLALAALAVRVVLEVVLRHPPRTIHEEAGAFALIFVGAACCVLQAVAAAASKERVNGLLLGVAFILWGLEQFLPPGPLAIAVDTCVIGIFVVDLSLIVLARLRAS